MFCLDFQRRHFAISYPSTTIENVDKKKQKTKGILHKQNLRLFCQKAQCCFESLREQPIFRMEKTLDQKKKSSTFQDFMERAANIMMIWEIILSNVSGTDVVNCLKVSKGLRFLVKQCILRNSMIRQKVDAAITVSALKKGFILSKFSHRMAFVGSCDAAPAFCLDGAWYNSTNKVLRKVGPHGKVIAATLPAVNYDFIRVFPTMDNKEIFVATNQKLTLFNLDSKNKYSIVEDDETIEGEERIPQRLCYIQYRLYICKGSLENEVSIAMQPRNRYSKNPKDGVTLHMLEKKDHSNFTVHHMTSNEEVRTYCTIRLNMIPLK